MLDFIRWLVNGDPDLSYRLLNRYKPDSVEDLWDKIDNVNMICGIAYMHFRISGRYDCPYIGFVKYFAPNFKDLDFVPYYEDYGHYWCTIPKEAQDQVHNKEAVNKIKEIVTKQALIDLWEMFNERTNGK